MEGQTVPQRLRERARQHHDRPFSWTRGDAGPFEATTWEEMWQTVAEVGIALKAIGVGRGDHIGIMSHNRREWIITDLAILGVGAADVPRGSDSTAEEMAYILAHAECRVAFAEDAAQCDKILSQRERLPLLERIILFEEYRDGTRPSDPDVTLMSWTELQRVGAEQGADGRAAFEAEVDAGRDDELATLLYTSGTTGEPKGVMLQHRSFIFQMDRLEKVLFLTPQDIFLTVLPVWHSFERAVEYICLNYGASLAYSKPIGKIMLADMAEIRPTWMTSVPRIWEGVRAGIYRAMQKESVVKQAMFHFFVGVGEIASDLSLAFTGRIPRFQRRSRLLDATLAAVPLLLITPLRLLGDLLVFNRIKGRLGGRFVAGVSGGGALPPYVDKFFRAAGVRILEGYGLTETGPVLAVRPQLAPKPGTVGPILPDVEFRVIGEGGQTLGPGEKGELHVRSPQVMMGYYRKPEETARVLDADGWLNTGDLVMMTWDDEIRIVGRTKETIVLLGGENVEPQPIEEAILQSNAIDQVMVVGQDQKFLGALVVPNEEAVTAFARESGLSDVGWEDLIHHEAVKGFVHRHVQDRVNGRTGFKTFEQIFRVAPIATPFREGDELTRTLKVRRSVVAERYRNEIADLFR